MINKKAKLLLALLLVALIAACTSTKDSVETATDSSATQLTNGFDFSTWKLTLPISKPGGGSAQEIKVPEMMAGYTSEYFYYNEEGAMVFYCPIGMASTINSNYSRSELRELIDGKNTDVNWTLHGTHNFSTRERVTQVPSNGRVVTSQIHGIYPDGTNGPVLVKVEYNGVEEHVVVLLKTATYKNAADERHYLRDVKLGEEFSTTIKVVQGRVFVTVTTADKKLEASKDFYMDDPTWDNYEFYYKVGNYAQDSIKDYEGEAATVIVYEMETSHTDVVENIKPESIILPEAISMEKGQDARLDVAFAPFDTSNTACTWDLVKGDDVIALSKDGQITALKEGVAVIRAKSIEKKKGFLFSKSVSGETVINVGPKTEKVATVIYNNDFESPLGSEWELLNAENGTLEIKDGKLTFLDTEKGISRKAILDLGELKGTATVEFDVVLDRLDIKDRGNSKEQASYYYIDVNSASNENLFRIRSKADLTNGKLVDPRVVLSRGYLEPKINKEAAKTPIGTPHRVTMVIRVDDNSAKSNTTDVYVDGLKVGDQIKNNSKHPGLGRIEIFTGTKDMLDFSVDNLVIYEGVKLPEGAAPTEVSIDPVASKLEVGGATRIGTDGDTTFAVVTGKDVAAVSDTGLVTGLSTGLATIKIGKSKMVNIEIVDTIVKPESMGLEKDFVVLHLEEQFDLNKVVNFLPADTTVKEFKVRVTEGKDLVSIEDGVVTGLGLGKVNLMVTSLGDSSLIKFINLSVVKKADRVVKVETFDNYEAGTQIDKTADYWSVEKVDGTTMIAEVNSTMSSSAPNALYILDDSPSNKPYALIEFADGIAPSGSVSFDAFISSQNFKTCYVNFGNGKNNSNRYFELRLNSIGSVETVNSAGEVVVEERNTGVLEYENSAGDVEIATFSRDEWHTFTAEWANGAFSVYVDGVLAVENITVKSTGLNVENIPTMISFVAGDTKTTGTRFYIDNLTSDLF